MSSFTDEAGSGVCASISRSHRLEYSCCTSLTTCMSSMGSLSSTEPPSMRSSSLASAMRLMWSRSSIFSGKGGNAKPARSFVSMSCILPANMGGMYLVTSTLMGSAMM